MSDKVEFFKPEDFYQIDDNRGVTHQFAEIIADRANAKLERECVRVYGHVPAPGMPQGFSVKTEIPPTHTALLINIQPIEKCKHSKEVIKKVICVYEYNDGKEQELIYKCQCGVKVKPKTFEECE